MHKHIGCCRYIWNYMINLQCSNYESGNKYMSAFTMINLLKPLKNDGEHKWLCEVSNQSLATVCRDVDKAYQRLFKKQAKKPKFKSKKRSNQAFPVRGTIWFKDNVVTIEKLGKVKFKSDFEFPQGRGNKFTNTRISEINGKWMLSFGMECENQAPELNDYSMGIDLGVKDLAIAECNGQIVFHNINKSKKMRALNKKLEHLQRAVSRKYEANKQGKKYIKTKNIEREEQKVRNIHNRISNIRNNYIHQCTHALISMLPKRVVVEDLNVKGMMKNKYLSRAIQEQCFGEFLRQMQYKCEWNGIEFVMADRFYPSSKTCSCCGVVKTNLKLSDRIYRCESCGLVIDRDYNAAINLSRYVA